MKYFIFGMIFATVITPILDSAAVVLITILESIKGRFSIKIAEYNDKIQKLGEEPVNTRVIGFAAPTEEEEVDYEEY